MLRSWKGKQQKAFADACDFVMRKVSWWHDFAHVSLKERVEELIEKTNNMIKNGYGHPREPAFKGKKAWRCGNVGTEETKVYHKMMNMVSGMYNDADTEKMLCGVDERRARWYRAEADSARPALQEKLHKSSSDRVDRTKASRKRTREDSAP